MRAALLVLLLAGCASMTAPPAAQITACTQLLHSQLDAGTLSKTDAQAADAQMRAQPPVLPAQCVGKV